MRFRIAGLGVLLIAGCGSVLGQGLPRGTANANVNGKKVSIEYGRPSLKGRTMDELLKKLPADRMWRAGADQVTTLTTEADLMAGGKRVKGGKYTLYVHAPEKGDWSLAINSDPGIELIKLSSKAPPALAHALWPRLDGYQKNISSSEVARVALKSGTASSAIDMFTITLDPATDGALLTIAWGNRTWSAELKAAK
jgi:hypothetical protein